MNRPSIRFGFEEEIETSKRKAPSKTELSNTEDAENESEQSSEEKEKPGKEESESTSENKQRKCLESIRNCSQDLGGKI